MVIREQVEARKRKTGKVLERGEMVELRDTSPYWQIVFSLYGTRVSKSSGTRKKREAEKMAKALWQERDDQHVRIHGKRGVPTKQRDARLLDAAEWHFTHVGSKSAGAEDTRRRLFTLVDALGSNTMLSDITDERVIGLIADLQEYDTRDDPRNGKFSDDLVNKHVMTLRHLMNVAIGTRKFYLPDAPYWPRHTLANVPRTREADIPEIDAITSRWRLDMRPALLFLFESGLRLRNAVELTWAQVDWVKGVIRVKVKTVKRGEKRPRRDAEANRRPREIPITPAIAEILARQMGKHDTAVFTFTSMRTGLCARTGRWMVRGRHYPLTKNYFQHHWKDVRRGCKIKDLRIHDLRRTRGSWLYRATGDIKLVKEFLHHANIRTTDAVYAHVAPEQVAEGLRLTAEYEARLRARQAALADAYPALGAGFAGIATGMDRGKGLSRCQGSKIPDPSTSLRCSTTSIEDAREILQRLQLNPRFKSQILDAGEFGGPLDEPRAGSESALSRTLRKPNHRKIAEAKSLPRDLPCSPWEDRAGARLLRFCEPYMGDPDFLISFVEALDRCFSSITPAA